MRVVREPNEKELERRFVAQLKERIPGVATIKLSMPGPFGSRGWPDRLVLLTGGRSVFVELKRKGGVLSELQKVALARLKKLGFAAYVAEGREGVEKIIEELCK